MTYPLVLDLAADGVPVAVTCRVLGFSGQAFYAWQHKPVSDRDLDDAYLTHAALQIHADDPGFGYLCAIKDVYSNRIVGYSISDRMKAALAVDALNSAVARRGRVKVEGCVVHSDRGSQFRSRKFVAALNAHGFQGSIGRVASAGDNAAMESFFGLLQKNVLDTRRWTTGQQLRLAIVTWIERTYHRRRRQRRLGRLTPIEFETIYQAANAA